MNKLVELSLKPGADSGDFYKAGLPHIYMRRFMSWAEHAWCMEKYDYYTWTMQYLWFNEQWELDSFVRRFVYPTVELQRDGHRFAIQLDDSDQVAKDDLIDQMNKLGANPPIAYGQSGPRYSAPLGLYGDEHPGWMSVWVAVNEDQAMIAKMMDLPVLEVDPAEDLTPHWKSDEIEESVYLPMIAAYKEKIKERFGLIRG